MPTLHGYYPGDDFGLIHVSSNQPPWHFLWLFWQPWEDAYGSLPDELRPTVALSYQFDFFWGSGAVEAFHSSNIAFHVLNSLLVFLIARYVARVSLSGALVAGCLFAILPVHAETVSWISGRADSIPAMFYLASVLAYAVWRRSAQPDWLYVVSLVVFVLALFSKQYAITMIVTLFLYDLLVGGKLHTRPWQSLQAYVPFVVLTVAYLALRYVLFHNLVREGPSLLSLITRIPAVQEQNVEMLLFQARVTQDLPQVLRILTRGTGLVVIAVGFTPVFVQWRRTGRVQPGSSACMLAYMGPLWWIISVLPLTVTYLTPRHLYLAAVGVAVTCGLLWDLVRRAGRRGLWVGVIAALAVFGMSLQALESGVSDWVRSATISRTIAEDLQDQVSQVPVGGLVLVGASPLAGAGVVDSLAETGPVNPPPREPWLWSWVMPYAAQPPFVPTEISERVWFIERRDVYCCLRLQWLAHIRESIAAWSNQADPTLIVLVWDSSTGAMARSTDAEDRCLRTYLPGPSDSPEDVDARLAAALQRVRVGQNGSCTMYDKPF